MFSHDGTGRSRAAGEAAVRVMVALLPLTLVGCGATANSRAGRGLEYEAPKSGYEPWVPVTVTYVPARMLPETCDVPPDRLVGCSKLWPGERCEIMVAEGLGVDLTKRVLAHERAHCGGWRHDE